MKKISNWDEGRYQQRPFYSVIEGTRNEIEETKIKEILTKDGTEIIFFTSEKKGTPIKFKIKITTEAVE